MNELMEVPVYERICWTLDAGDRTDFMRGLLLLSWGIVTFFLSFFWSSNVQVTCSEFARLGLWRCNSRFPKKKRILWMQQSLVFLSDVALTYSQDLQAQKKSAMERVLSAFWVCVVDLL